MSEFDLLGDLNKEVTQGLVKTKTDNLNITLSALRDAIVGGGPKTLTDLFSALTSAGSAPLTLTIPDAATAGVADSIIVAAGTTGERQVVLAIPATADTGIHINAGAAATAAKFLMAPNSVLQLNTNQAIHAMRAGGTDVTVYVITGVP